MDRKYKVGPLASGPYAAAADVPSEEPERPDETTRPEVSLRFEGSPGRELGPDARFWPELGFDASRGFESQSEADSESISETRLAIVSRQLHGERLDKALVTIAGEFSRNHLQSLIER